MATNNILTRVEWLTQEHLCPHGTDLHLPWRLLHGHSVLIPELPGLIHHGLNEGGRQCCEDAIEELALSFVVGAPVVRHVPKEIPDATSFGPDTPDAQLRPVGDEQGWDVLPLDDGLLVSQDLLHESQRASAFLWKKYLHVVAQIFVQVCLASMEEIKVKNFGA